MGKPKRQKARTVTVDGFKAPKNPYFVEVVRAQNAGKTTWRHSAHPVHRMGSRSARDNHAISEGW